MESGNNSARSQVIISHTASFDGSTSSGGSSARFRKKKSVRRRSNSANKKGCAGRSSRWKSIILRTLIHGTEEKRRVPSSNRLEDSEPIHKVPFLSNGERPQSSGSTSEGRMVNVSRSIGRLSARSSPQESSTIHESAHFRADLGIHSNVFRFVHSPSNFHKTTSAGGSLSTTERGNTSSLPRRLAHKSTVTSTSIVPHSTSGGNVQSARLVDQLQEVRTSPQAAVDFPGHGYQPRSRIVTPHDGEMSNDSGLVEMVKHPERSVSPELSVTVGTVESCCESSAPGSATCTSTATLPSNVRIRSSFTTRRTGPITGSVLSSSQLVGQPMPSSHRNSCQSSYSNSHPLLGRKSDSMGGVNSQDFGSGTMDCRRKEATHFRTRDESCEVRGASSSGRAKRHMHPGDVGQCFSDCLPKKSGGNQINSPLQGSKGPTPVVSGGRDRVDSDLSSRETECRRRPAFATRSNSEHGVGSVSSCVSPSTESSPRNGDRPICHEMECEVAPLRFPFSRCRSMGDGQPVNLMGGDDSLRLSSNSHHIRGCTENSQRGMSDSVSGTPVARPALVSSHIRPSGRLSNSATREQKASFTAGNLLQRPSTVKASRVLAIQRNLVQEGFSSQVAERAASGSLRESSLRLYQSHYKRFSSWCSEREISPEFASVQDLGDFLLYLHSEKLSVKTISNYRSALSPIIRPLEGVSAGHHPTITNLLKSLQKEEVPVRNRVPDWDLSVVLARLRQPPFEPLKWDDTHSRLLVSMKTAFLLALASARRRGELQAISRDQRDVVFSAKGVSLRTVAGFLPKTALAGHDPKPFFIPSLGPYAGNDSDDRLLCPVRALRFYLTATGGYKADSHLFVKLRGDEPVSSQTISSWLVRCIRTAYEGNISAKAHEVRRAATSWAYVSGKHDLQDILNAGTWASHTTFSSFYLADVKKQLDDRFRFPTVVAGKAV